MQSAATRCVIENKTCLHVCLLTLLDCSHQLLLDIFYCSNRTLVERVCIQARGKDGPNHQSPDRRTARKSPTIPRTECQTVRVGLQVVRRVEEVAWWMEEHTLPPTNMEEETSEHVRKTMFRRPNCG